MRSLLVALLLALNGSALLAQMSPPEVDTAEVFRRGDTVTIAGEGPRSGDEEAYRAAMAPPALDDQRWYITLICSKGCAPCERLKQDFFRSPDLMAFVSAPDEAKAWAHFNVFMAEDTTQQWRLSAYKVTAYPTVIVQTPRDGSWGPKGTVIYQQSGYDGDAKKLAGNMRTALRAYAAKVQESRSYGIVLGGSRQAYSSPYNAGYNPPFPMETQPSPVPGYPSMFPPADATQPPPPPTNSNLGGILTTLLVVVLSVTGLGALAGVIFAVWAVIRSVMKSRGVQTALTDAQFNQLRSDVLSGLANQNRPTPNPNPQFQNPPLAR
jgi:hypothetical protein